MCERVWTRALSMHAAHHRCTRTTTVSLLPRVAHSRHARGSCQASPRRRIPIQPGHHQGWPFRRAAGPHFFPINESHERLSKLSSAAWADRMAPSGAGTLLVGRRARKTGRKRGWKSVPRKLADSQTQAAAAARSVFDGGAGESQKRASEASMLGKSSIRMSKENA